MNGFSFLSLATLSLALGVACAKSPSQFIASDLPFYENPNPVASQQLWPFNEGIEVRGNTAGFGDLRKDGFVDFSLVMPAFSRAELFQLEFTSLISPQTDTLDLPLGQSAEVPSNVTFPKQKERYSFINIKFNKPRYRFYVTEPGVYKMTATHGKMPLKRMIDDARDGKSLFEMINHFEFLQSGSVDVIVNDTAVDGDINVNGIRFDSTIGVLAPQLNAGDGMLSIAFADQNGLLIPTDIKSLKSGERRDLKSITQSDDKVLLHMLRRDDVVVQSPNLLEEIQRNETKNSVNFNQISMVVQSPEEASEAPRFLELIPGPTVTESDIQMAPPTTTLNFASTATTVSFLEVEIVSQEQGDYERATVIWSETFEGWSTFMEKPNLKINPDPNRIYRWQVSFAGQMEPSEPSGQFIDFARVTHVTRNATDVQIQE